MAISYPFGSATESVARVLKLRPKKRRGPIASGNEAIQTGPVPDNAVILNDSTALLLNDGSYILLTGF